MQLNKTRGELILLKAKIIENKYYIFLALLISAFLIVTVGLYDVWEYTHLAYRQKTQEISNIEANIRQEETRLSYLEEELEKEKIILREWEIAYLKMEQEVDLDKKEFHLPTILIALDDSADKSGLEDYQFRFDLMEETDSAVVSSIQENGEAGIDAEEEFVAEEGVIEDESEEIEQKTDEDNNNDEDENEENGENQDGIIDEISGLEEAEDTVGFGLREEVKKAATDAPPVGIRITVLPLLVEGDYEAVKNFIDDLEEKKNIEIPVFRVRAVDAGVSAEAVIRVLSLNPEEFRDM